MNSRRQSEQQATSAPAGYYKRNSRLQGQQATDNSQQATGYRLQEEKQLGERSHVICCFDVFFVVCFFLLSCFLLCLH
jgi:hypothetical protein